MERAVEGGEDKWTATNKKAWQIRNGHNQRNGGKFAVGITLYPIYKYFASARIGELSRTHENGNRDQTRSSDQRLISRENRLSWGMKAAWRT